MARTRANMVRITQEGEDQAQDGHDKTFWAGRRCPYFFFCKSVWVQAICSQCSSSLKSSVLLCLDGTLVRGSIGKMRLQRPKMFGRFGCGGTSEHSNRSNCRVCGMRRSSWMSASVCSLWLERKNHEDILAAELCIDMFVDMKCGQDEAADTEDVFPF